MAKKKDLGEAAEELMQLEQEQTHARNEREYGPLEDHEPGAAMFLDAMMQAASKQFGQHNVYVATEQEKRVYGISLDHNIALQYLIDSNVLPMQSIVTLSGPPKTYKTSGVLDLQGLFIKPPVNGQAFLIHTEGKMSPTKISSMLREHTQRLVLKGADSVDDWQDTAGFFLKTIKSTLNKIRIAQRGRKYKEYKEMTVPPIAIGIDSLIGAQSDTMIEQVFKDGSAPGKTFQDRAAKITQWLNVWASNLTSMPVTLIISNHLKDGMDGNKYNPGGIASGFHTSLDIRVSRIKDLDKARSEGALLQWKVHFSSIGRDKRAIQIEYIETYDENGKQLAGYDWNGALVKLLLELKGSTMYPKLAEVIDISEHDKGGVGKVYSSKSMGISIADAMEQKTTATIMGQRIYDTPGLGDAIRDALYIQKHQVWNKELTQDATLAEEEKEE